jgi:hypothetical protein
MTGPERSVGYRRQEVQPCGVPKVIRQRVHPRFCAQVFEPLLHDRLECGISIPTQWIESLEYLAHIEIPNENDGILGRATVLVTVYPETLRSDQESDRASHRSHIPFQLTLGGIELRSWNNRLRLCDQHELLSFIVQSHNVWADCHALTVALRQLRTIRSSRIDDFSGRLSSVHRQRRILQQADLFQHGRLIPIDMLVRQLAFAKAHNGY